MEKKVIWIIGSNCSGKTTQSKLIHKNLNKSKYKQIINVLFTNSLNEDDNTFITLYDTTCHVGKVEDNQCTGTDSLSTKDKIEMSYLDLILNHDKNIVLIDGVLATSLWSGIINQVKPMFNIETSVYLLDYKTNEANYARLRQRRANKTGKPVESIVLEEKTLLNVAGKIKGFRSMFEKVKDDFNVSCIIDAELPIAEIHKIIVKKSKLK